VFWTLATEVDDLSDSSDRTRTTLTGRKLRPTPIAHAWIWIILTVGVVIMMTLTLWVVHHATNSKDTYVDVSGDWRVRWAQVPGPAVVYAASARSALVKGDLDEASRWLSKSLALNPQQPALWVQVVCISMVHEGVYTLDDSSIQRLMTGPLDGAFSVGDWVTRRGRLQSDHVAKVSWVNTCIVSTSVPAGAETTPETLDSGVGSP